MGADRPRKTKCSSEKNACTCYSAVQTEVKKFRVGPIPKKFREVASANQSFGIQNYGMFYEFSETLLSPFGALQQKSRGRCLGFLDLNAPI